MNEEVVLKTPKEIERLRQVNRLVVDVLNEIKELVKPGISTAEIDRAAEAKCLKMGAKPAFKGYQGFPASVCISVNDEVVHGIPSDRRILKDGDIVSLDFGAKLKGWYGDAAVTVGVGNVSPAAQKLMDATKEGLMRGIAQARPGNHLLDIGHAIQNYVEGLGFSVVRDFVGHGIGRSLHEDPQVPNFGPCGKGIPLREGMVLAIEPMVSAGSYHVKVLGDGWTAVTADHSLSAHFEHTIAITEKGSEVLTLG